MIWSKSTHNRLIYDKLIIEVVFCFEIIIKLIKKRDIN